MVIIKLPQVFLNIQPAMKQVNLSDETLEKHAKQSFAPKLQKELLKDYIADKDKVIYPKAVPSKQIQVAVAPGKIELII